MALAAITLWLTELIWRTGWDEFSWLWGSQSSIFGIIALVVIAYLLPVGVIRGISWKKLWLPGLELYFVGIIAFFLTKSIVYSLFLPFPVFDLSPYLLWLIMAMLVVTTASSFYYMTKNYLYPVKIAFIPLMVGAELLAAALSVLTAYLFMERGSFDQILLAAVRAGFPFFFITLLLGLMSVLSLRKLTLLRRGEPGEQQDEILDDMMMK
ncbi:hypothetical protein CRP01_06420 [Flavilitoribacter nigricans DSM 23189 = NBRC 102662]|uniref:Uncharacterized protein n=1 Tax=Flavilitoribacter nigricans (strain ATCC 23147 / DSM 23189 / NBRC 102662 / NCIMB 1420 / SS-2) TaxID=1122177 RepID=A0A2D0NFU7_FLAN2|nr:hypothetical protein CRP01_06420 [Flavilitoribacter nigricans DSM 23189 = NBRC 102662]